MGEWTANQIAMYTDRQTDTDRKKAEWYPWLIVILHAGHLFAKPSLDYRGLVTPKYNMGSVVHG